jgi:hypothetical protein
MAFQTSISSLKDNNQSTEAKPTEDIQQSVKSEESVKAAAGKKGKGEEEEWIPPQGFNVFCPIM